MPPVISQPVPSLPTANLPAKLFVGQIPRTCNEATIRTLFQQFGEVSEIYMMKDKSTNGHKGAAFVTFVDMAAAQMAIKHLDKQYHLAQQKKPLQVRLADSPAMGQGYQATDPFAFAKQAAMAAMKLQAQTNSPQKSKRKQCPPRLDQKVFVTMQDGQVAVFSPSGRFDGHFYPEHQQAAIEHYKNQAVMGHNEHQVPMGHYEQQVPMGHYEQQVPMGHNEQQVPMGHYEQQLPMRHYEQQVPMGHYE
jgi:RNA recognition motif-containing protein